MTVLEHLELYASIKGVKPAIRQRIIEKQLVDMDLKSYEDTRAGQLSGGNRRKLSVSMAIMGNPPLIFLDEPSTGVDPQAKRFMWNIVSKISTQQKKSAVILTTHSMEEAEALCTKMGIMVRGEFKCFGGATHIKDKYGTGFELEVKIRTLSDQEVDELVQKATQKNLIPFKKVSQCNAFLREFGSPELVDEMTAEGIGFEYVEMEKKKMVI